MPYGLEITPIIQQYTAPYQDSIRLRVVITNSNGMTTKVFRYRALPLQPDDPNATLELHFDGVCSPVDLVEMPEDAPLQGADPPWARLDYVDLLFRSRRDALEALTAIKGELTALVEAMEDSDNLSSMAAEWIGTSI